MGLVPSRPGCRWPAIPSEPGSSEPTSFEAISFEAVSCEAEVFEAVKPESKPESHTVHPAGSDCGPFDCIGRFDCSRRLNLSAGCRAYGQRGLDI